MKTEILQFCGGVISLPRRSISRRCRCSDAESSSFDRPVNLTETIKRKQRELSERIEEIGEEDVLDRLAGAVTWENPNPHRFAQLVTTIKMIKGRPVLVFEIERSENEGSEALAEKAQLYESCSADALSVPIDSDKTAEGIKDLFIIANAVKIPVFARDWFIHPLQILDAKEAGASGILGVISSVSKTGTHLLSSFAASIGIDTPVEVINLQEVEEMSRLGIPMYSTNVSVGLSLVGISGVASEIASGILHSLPAGAIALVGVRTESEVRKATLAGADGLLIPSSFTLDSSLELAEFINALMYMTSGDD